MPYKDLEIQKEYRKMYYNKNKRKIIISTTMYASCHKEQRKETLKRYYEKNKDVIAQRHKQFKSDHPDIVKRWKTKCQLSRRSKRNEWERNKRISDPVFKLRQNLRSRIRHAFKNIISVNKDCHTFDIIGILPKELKIYIENKFTHGMNWGNYGRGGWEIDHIVPLSSAATKEELIKLCHYTNLQPLWKSDNVKKSNKTGEYK